MTRSAFGTIRQLPSRRYQAMYRRDGVVHTAPQTFVRRRSAEAWLHAVRTFSPAAPEILLRHIVAADEGAGINFPRRAIPAALRRDIAEEYDWVCHLCEQFIWHRIPRSRVQYGEDPGRRGHLAIDHIVPIRIGGSDEVWNLAPAHFACNSARGASPLGLWEHERQFQGHVESDLCCRWAPFARSIVRSATRPRRDRARWGELHRIAHERHGLT